MIFRLFLAPGQHGPITVRSGLERYPYRLVSISCELQDDLHGDVSSRYTPRAPDLMSDTCQTLKNYPLVPHPPGHAFSIQIFQQRNRILAAYAR